MPKVTQEHREAMKLHIKHSALTCLARKGFSAVTMGDIISEADLSAGAVYLYYKSKESLLLDVGRDVMAERTAMLLDLKNQVPLPSPAAAMALIFDDIAHDPLTSGLPVQVWGESVGNPKMRRAAIGILDSAKGHVANYIAAWLSQERNASAAQAKARADELAPAILGLVQGFIVQASMSATPTESAQQYSKAVAMLLHNM